MFMAEILAFPSGKKITTTKTDPRLVNLELREDNANAVADNMIMGMIQDLEDTNHKINDNHMKDFGFFVESLRSLVYKLGGL